MNRVRGIFLPVPIPFSVCAFVIVAAAIVVTGCPKPPAGPDLKARDFVQVNRNGFGYIENLIDLNDYPWGLVYFQPDGAAEGHVYVSTGNGIDDQVLYEIGEWEYPIPPLRPGEIRRFRPDLGPRRWQSVLDIRNYEWGPVFNTTGFRAMQVYRPEGENEPNYLYAGSASTIPSLWRSASGERFDWEIVWSDTRKGSIRTMVVHDGILYFNFIPGGEIGDGSPGEVWAHDGKTVWNVVNDGFGNPDNRGIWTLASFNGYLYASVANLETGFEVWKLEGPNSEPPKLALANGGSDPANEAAATSLVYKDKLYFGTQVFGGFTSTVGGQLFKGGDLIRLDADDNMEVVVGPNSVSGFGSGFDRSMNAYIWSLEEFNGELYVGTWDQATIYQYVVDYFPESISQLISFLVLVSDYGNTEKFDTELKRSPTPLSTALEAGGDIYRSPDGDTFTLLMNDGFGDPYNYGARNMLAVGDDLYVGMANIYEGIEIWRGTRDEQGR
jgi:hypothetical protein